MGGCNESADNLIYSRMPGWPFITKCPCCDNNEDCKWHHASDSGLQTIDREGYIHCEKCSLNEFLMDLRYDCGRHNNEFKDPNFKRICYAISQLATHKTLPEDVCENIIAKITKRKFNL
jgi:hypothetical protein